MSKTGNGYYGAQGSTRMNPFRDSNGLLTPFMQGVGSALHSFGVPDASPIPRFSLRVLGLEKGASTVHDVALQSRPTVEKCGDHFAITCFAKFHDDDIARKDASAEPATIASPACSNTNRPDESRTRREQATASAKAASFWSAGRPRRSLRDRQWST